MNPSQSFSFLKQLWGEKSALFELIQNQLGPPVNPIASLFRRRGFGSAQAELTTTAASTTQGKRIPPSCKRLPHILILSPSGEYPSHGDAARPMVREE